jgi:predicted NUDIX family phosphoesterase
MKSKLSTDILLHGDKSSFMRSDKGKFALREWHRRLPEFTADRYQKALFDEDILVMPASSLTRFVLQPGLSRKPPNSSDFISEFRNMRRREAENDHSVIQLVSVFIIRHLSRVLTYKRTKRLPESRLHGYYSLSFGGHLNPNDIISLFNIFNPNQFQPWLMRELNEEVKISSREIKKFAFRGLLYDISQPVSRQHLGITYEINVASEDFQIGERGFLMDAKYESVAQIIKRRDQFENWSLLLLDELGPEWK